jgi:hypothetical protein
MKTRLAAAAAVVAALTACGGGGNPSPVVETTSESAAPAMPPGGLYLGYYAEDPASNPEDPMLGAFTLNLPAGNGDFSGSMSFTYVGCQTSNVGIVTGTKTDLTLSGTWSGTVDGVPQSGPYSGTFDATNLSYAGIYSNAGGKQYRDLRPCIAYYIAPAGTWEMFPAEMSVPASFIVGVSGRTISWSAVHGAALSLVYVIDPAIAQGTGNPVVWQAVVPPGVGAQVPAAVALQTGRPYVVAIGIVNQAGQRLAFGSARFVP